MTVSVFKNVCFDESNYAPLIRVADAPGKYTAKIDVFVENTQCGLEFFLDYENENSEWTASNACAMAITHGCSDGGCGGIVGIRRTTNVSSLEFVLDMPRSKTASSQSRTANVSVSVIGDHADGIVTIPDAVPDDVVSVSFDDGYRENGWSMEINRLGWYHDLFSSVAEFPELKTRVQALETHANSAIQILSDFGISGLMDPITTTWPAKATLAALDARLRPVEEGAGSARDILELFGVADLPEFAVDETSSTIETRISALETAGAAAQRALRTFGVDI